ncbi:hypothetical protein ACJD0Z_05695 [Flavobacteriaceae bacterium M23B6Z8]
MKHTISSKLWLTILYSFLTLAVNAQDENCKCCTEAHEAFDFWEGNWETYTPDGKLAGTNRLEKIQNGCVLRENWKSAKGSYTGTSYNFYNTADGQWEQLWIDNQGQHLHLKGNLEGENMVLSSAPIPQTDGSLVINRITWTPLENGTVRQHWETKKDDGEWITAFDGVYKPLNQE